MRVLFFMRSSVYVRNFESTLRLLAERGHEVHVVADMHPYFDPANLIGQLSAKYPGIMHSEAPDRPVNGWSLLGVELRRALDYLRYLEIDYGDAPKLRRRALKTAPAFLTRVLEQRFVNTTAGRRLLARLIRWCDRALPRDGAVDAFIREHQPDLVLVTPLVEPGSPQSDFVRSARAQGIRTGLCVYSWDNLTNKGLIHDSLDVVTVWNEPMKQEAVGLHRVPAERVAVTGAVAYDHWFTWTPRAARDAFCAHVGLDARRPYILYLCSSRFIAPDEAPFVRRWVEDLRARSATLRDAGILVRLHPQNVKKWHEADVNDLENVVIWPRGGQNPVDDDSRADYYDSMYHSAAVVGVNTSAQIESAIVGRGVYTLLAPEFRETQEGTLHFRHLREVSEGLLQVASTIEEHVAQLEDGLRYPEANAGKCRRFVEAFVRPHGIEEAATPRLVAALEETAARGHVQPDRGPWWRLLARPALGKAAASLAEASRTGKRHVSGSRHRKRDNASLAPAVASATATGQASTSGPFEHYLRVRSCVRGLRPPEPSSGSLTPSERRMLSTLDGLWDATPESVAALRRYGEAITGVRASDYDGSDTAIRERLARDLRLLLAKGYPALRIDEPAVLGAFGINGSGHLYNEDTLRFFRVLTLLQDAALLKEFRGSSSRRTVWEIGGGWGGFAYQFKTLCPDVTYLITGQPELLLLSGVYLSTVLPGASFRFYESANPDAFWRNWDSVDFAFLPESAIAGMRPPAVDLTVDLMALERMTPSRVGLHVQRAHELGSRYFFSVCPLAEPPPDIASPVRPAVERWYWPHPVSAPLFVSWRLRLRRETSEPVERTFLLGWRRLRA
jgi:putative sugar O-methyltransferase